MALRGEIIQTRASGSDVNITPGAPIVACPGEWDSCLVLDPERASGATVGLLRIHANGAKQRNAAAVSETTACKFNIASHW